MSLIFPSSIVLLVLNLTLFFVCILAFLHQRRHQRSDAKFVLSFLSALALIHVAYIGIILYFLF